MRAQQVPPPPPQKKKKKKKKGSGVTQVEHKACQNIKVVIPIS